MITQRHNPAYRPADLNPGIFAGVFYFFVHSSWLFKNLPEGYHEYVIDGGCHAYFGSYGEQDGDGTSTITNSEQIQATVDLLAH